MPMPRYTPRTFNEVVTADNESITLDAVNEVIYVHRMDGSFIHEIVWDDGEFWDFGGEVGCPLFDY